MKEFLIDGKIVDAVELKCLVVSRGVRVDKKVYNRFSKTHRLGINPLMCNCFFLSDGTIVQMTDMQFHLRYLTGILSWDNLKLLKYASDLKTPFEIVLDSDKVILRHNNRFVDKITFPRKTDFYYKRTANGLKYIGSAVMQGVDWVAFPCLWPCEYAASGKSCQFCFSGAEVETLTRKSKPLPKAVPAEDVAEIVDDAISNEGCTGVQITGGSTFNEKRESAYISAYLREIDKRIGIENIKCDVLLYITPPVNKNVLNDYFALGASKIACSLEVWDERRAMQITPGKMSFATRDRYLDALSYIANRHGPGKAFSNFIIGIEPLESLLAGAEYLAQRGIIPTASVWMPMGRPVMNSMKTPDVTYYRRVKERFAELYIKYKLEPSTCRGLNVCIERDIWNYAHEL